MFDFCVLIYDLKSRPFHYIQYSPYSGRKLARGTKRGEKIHKNSITDTLYRLHFNPKCIADCIGLS